MDGRNECDHDDGVWLRGGLVGAGFEGVGVVDEEVKAWMVAINATMTAVGGGWMRLGQR